MSDDERGVVVVGTQNVCPKLYSPIEDLVAIPNSAPEGHCPVFVGPPPAGDGSCSAVLSHFGGGDGDLEFGSMLVRHGLRRGLGVRISSLRDTIGHDSNGS